MKAAKTKDVEKYLSGLGWTVIRSKGGHDVWANPTGDQTIALPRHRETSPGILRQIDKLVGLPDRWK